MITFGVHGAVSLDVETKHFDKNGMMSEFYSTTIKVVDKFGSVIEINLYHDEPVLPSMQPKVVRR